MLAAIGEALQTNLLLGTMLGRLEKDWDALAEFAGCPSLVGATPTLIGVEWILIELCKKARGA